METFICENCSEKFEKEELDLEVFTDGQYLCKNCADNLAEAGWDAVDPDRNFKSFDDWDENGR